MSDSNNHTTSEEKGNRSYVAPQHTPHPDKTPIDPYHADLTEELEESSHKRALIMRAQNIRSTEAQLKKQLSQMQKGTTPDLRDVSINPRELMVKGFPHAHIARRARTAQQNLRTHYQSWATLCERHLAEVREQPK